MTVDETIVRGRFESGELEAEFRRQFGRAHWFQNSVAAAAGLFLYSIFGIVDRLVSPEEWRWLWQIRFGFTLPLLVAVFAVQFFPALGRRYSGPIVFVAMLLAGSSIVVMNLWMPPGAENLYFYGLLLVVIFGHVFWRAHYLWPTIASILLFVFYLAVTLGQGAPSPAHLVAATFYYVSALTIMIYAGWFFDRQERRSFMLQRELQQAATTDSLTGIANRRAFFDHLAQEWRRARREGEVLCLLVVDLDNMKEINDTGGHARGDEALKQVARVLAVHARRPGDLAARLGGDEFVLLLVGSDGKGACEVAEEVVEKVRRGPLSGVTVSIGVACVVPPRGQGYERAMQLADQALYEAKRGGRSRAVCKLLVQEEGGVGKPEGQISA